MYMVEREGGREGERGGKGGRKRGREGGRGESLRGVQIGLNTNSWQKSKGLGKIIGSLNFAVKDLLFETFQDEEDGHSSGNY